MALIKLDINSPVQPRQIEKRGNPLEIPGMLSNIGAVFGWVFGGQQSASGELIDDYSALSIMDVYGAIRIISNTIGSLPLKLYEHTKNGREEAVDNYLYSLLAVEPNPEMGATVFWETVIACMALTGNAFVYIQRVNGQVVNLWPLHPRRTKMTRVDDGTPTGAIVYEVPYGNQFQRFQSEDVLHFKLFSLDGMIGLDPLALAKEGLGLARSAEKTAGRVFANSASPGGIMMSKGGLDEKQLQNVRESWMAAQTGGNAFKTAFLNGNQWEYIPLTLNLEQLEFLHTRQFQRSEIAGFFGIDPHFLGDTTRMSNTNSEQQATNLIQFTLRPYITKIENEIQRKIMPTVGRKANKFFARFDVQDLLRGDYKTMMDGLTAAHNGGFMNGDECRQQLGLNPIADGTGKIYIVPVNYRNAKDLLYDPEPNMEEILNPPSGMVPDNNQPDDDDTPNADERSLVRHNPSIAALFNDCIGRYLNRDKHDLRAIETVFGPTLRHILSLCVSDANSRLGTDWADDKAEERILLDVHKGIDKRSTSWSNDQLASVAVEELRKALKTMFAAVYRECGASLVQ